MTVNLATLPPEIIISILCELPQPRDVLNAGLSCRSIHECSGENSIWIRLSRCFKYWNVKDFRPSEKQTWQSEVKRRYLQDAAIDEALNGLIANSEYLFMPKFKTVTAFGAEAKDRLVFHMDYTQEDAIDAISRRFWARRLLGACHRQAGFEILTDVFREKESSLERIYSIADMITVENEYADVDLITAELDRLADEFKQHHTEWQSMTELDLLQIAVTYLIETKHFTGARYFLPVRHYLAQHMSISKTLFNDSHAGTDLVYSVIFSSILQRLGLQAWPVEHSHRYFVTVQDLEFNGERLIYDVYGLHHGLRASCEIARDIGYSGPPGELILQSLSPKRLLEAIKRSEADLRERLYDPHFRPPLTTESEDVQPYYGFLRNNFDLVLHPSNPEGTALIPMYTYAQWLAYSVVKFLNDTNHEDDGVALRLLRDSEVSDSKPEESWRHQYFDIRDDATHQPKFRIGHCVRYPTLDLDPQLKPYECWQIGVVVGWTYQEKKPYVDRDGYNYTIQ
jgi:hypothetical protein